ncbi:MAG TPA: serine/threonine-protein kinase [Solirubrobacterales bacterium]|nr:serine/threonine-protein kinase [Solirubrobacterales bacterium]
MSGVFAQGELLKDRYRLERLLGRGGMAAVWLGHDEVLDRPVAVKVPADTIAADPEFATRFRREAHTAAGVNHPNLVGVYDYSDEERPYLVMQFVAGEDLGTVLARDGRVDCQRLAHELLDALDHIHSLGILHRDVKPGNVLIDREGNAKLIDFGIAQTADATSLTRTGLILGTERYLAPEVARGEPASERSDLYSCGVVLRSCLEASGGSAALRSLVEWLTAEDPRSRPASARQALAQLDRPQAAVVTQPTEAFDGPDGPVPALDEDPRPTGTVRPGRKAVAAALGVLAALLVGAVVLVAGGGGGSDPPRAQAKQAGDAKPQAEGQPAPEEEAAREGQAAAQNASTAAPAEPEGGDSARGAALNEEGYALIQAGEYTAAVPVLEEAVRAFPPDTEAVEYAYALYNLGSALRRSGRASEAVPVLERRLEIPNQTATVRRELEAARAEAG